MGGNEYRTTVDLDTFFLGISHGKLSYLASSIKTNGVYITQAVASRYSGVSVSWLYRSINDSSGHCTSGGLSFFICTMETALLASLTVVMSFKLENVCETIIVEGCYGLNCVLPNSYIEALTHQYLRMCLDLGIGPLQR